MKIIYVLLHTNNEIASYIGHDQLIVNCYYLFSYRDIKETATSDGETDGRTNGQTCKADRQAIS